MPTGPATGTGTDCIAVAAPAGQGRHAGLQTASAEAAVQAVLSATRAGVARWMQEARPAAPAQRQGGIHP
ncbi:hypothetical protein HCZ97_06765 [Pseudooceanicola sp. HF7]|nr:hypothetical protein [Pseudooceanicola sp. HF7]